MRLRPLFSSPNNRQSLNSSKSLHNCPSCKCQSPTHNSIIKDFQTPVKNIYTNSALSLASSRLKGFRKYLQVSQITSSQSKNQQKDILYRDRNIKQKYAETFKQTAHFKTPSFNRNLIISENILIKPNPALVTNKANHKKNVMIRYCSPQLIRSKSQNKIGFFGINDIGKNNNQSFVVRQPSPQFSFIEQPRFTLSKQLYFQKGQQKQQSHQIRQLYYADQANSTFNVTHEDIPPQPRILIDKKNSLKFKKSNASSDSKNSNLGVFQKTIKQGSDITSVGSKTSSKNCINQQKQQAIQKQRKSQKRLTMNRNVKGKKIIQNQQNSLQNGNNNINKMQNVVNDSESDQPEQIVNEQILTEQKSEKHDQFDTTKQDTQDNRYPQFIQKKHSQQIYNNYLKSSNQGASDQNIKRTLPFTKTSKTIQVQVTSKSDPVNIVCKIEDPKYSVSSGYKITSLQKMVDINRQSSDVESINYTNRSKKSESRFPNFQKKRTEYAQQMCIKPQQQYSRLRHKKSRSRSNEDRSAANSREKVRQQSKKIVQQGKQSLEIATQLMEQLKLYYQYYQAKNQSDSSIERHA